MSHWPWWTPIIAIIVVIAAYTMTLDTTLVVVCAVALVGAVIASVHHAEVIAHRIGEPLGTVVLSICVTIIEVALITTVMLGGANEATLPRDTIYSVIMITCGGVVGLSIFIGAVRHREQVFQMLGSNAALATLAAMTTLALVLPNFTTSSPGPTYTSAQLIFASVASVALWCGFVFVQTVRTATTSCPSARGLMRNCMRAGRRAPRPWRASGHCWPH